MNDAYFPMQQIFISYPRDKTIGQSLARELYSFLKQRHIPVFFDEDGIPFGDRWLAVLKEAVANSKIMLWIISDASQDSKWQKREVAEAERLGLRIIPLLAEDMPLPMEVNDQQAAFLFGDQKRDQLDKLLIFLESELGIDRIAPLLKHARDAKSSEAYKEAITKWQEILVINPDYPGAHVELEKLAVLLQQQVLNKSLLDALVLRMNDILPIFVPVAGVLNQVGKHPQTEQVLEHTQAFIGGRLSADEYISLCQALLSQQHMSTMAGKTPTNYAKFAERVVAGEVVLFIGSELMREYGQDVPAEADFIRELAEKADFAGFQGSFSSIAEYYRLNKDYGENLLLKELRHSLNLDGQSLNLYRLLAKIDKPLILISSAYDDALERSFDEAGKPYVELTSLVRPCESHGVGHIVVRHSGQKEPEIYQPIEEEISRFNWYEDKISLIFKIRGTCSNEMAKHDYQRDAMTLAESDYFSFARHADDMIPAYLVKRMRDKVLLFVGFSPKSWEERLLVNALMARRDKVYPTESTYTVGTSNDPLEAAYWASQHVQQQSIDMHKLDEYLEALL